MDSSSKHRLKNFLLCSLSILMVLLSTDLSIAKQVTFEREYTYQASEADSKLSCRAIALAQVKRLLLEELGTYLESCTEIKDYKLTRDQITTLTAGIVQTEIIDEKWDGKAYILKAKIVADPDSVLKAIDELRKDRYKEKELRKSREESEKILKELTILREDLRTTKEELKKVKIQKEYTEKSTALTAWEWLDRGYAYFIAGKNQDAIYAYTRAIQLGLGVYTLRGLVFSRLKDYQKAIIDYTEAIELDTKDARAGAYYSRGDAYSELGNYNQAIADYTRAIKLDPKFASAYAGRGFAYDKLGNYQQAIADYTIAIELSPKYAWAYFSRGLVYEKLGNYNQAIVQYSKAIELDPKLAGAYFFRGASYHELGNYQAWISDVKTAARLGFKPAQDYLREKGISW
ncbi:MAG: tetratricopeptide repeat protein [Thermodesulfobacteriota bacterium]